MAGPVVVTATEASRSLAAVLERARRGERFTVVKNGEPVAQILPPAPAPNAAAVLAVFDRWAEEDVFDAATEAAVAAFREDGGEDRLSWAGV